MEHPNAQNFASHAYCPEISEIHSKFSNKGVDTNGLTCSLVLYALDTVQLLP